MAIILELELLIELFKRSDTKKYKVLEIGCGWGSPIICAKEFETKRIDADKNVLPYLQLHAEINGQKMFGKENFNQLTVGTINLIF